MIQKVIRAGKHSLAVIIPAHFIHSLGIKAGDTVSVSTDMQQGRVHIKFSGAVQLSFPKEKKE